MRKLTVRWVPKSLSDEQMATRASVCSDLLKHFRSKDDFLLHLVTVDETWVHYYEQRIKLRVPASVAQLDAPSDWRSGDRGFSPRRGRQHSFVDIDHEIFSTVILSLPLIQEGQLSVSGERMCTILINRLED